jgi:hypothetical protein
MYHTRLSLRSRVLRGSINTLNNIASPNLSLKSHIPASEANRLNRQPISTNSNLFRPRELKLKLLSQLEVSFNKSNLHTQYQMPAISKLPSKCNMRRRRSLPNSRLLRHRRTLRNKFPSKRPSKCRSRIPTNRHRRHVHSTSKCRHLPNSLDSLDSHLIRDKITKLFSNRHSLVLLSSRTFNNLCLSSNRHSLVLLSSRISNSRCLSSSHRRKRTRYSRLQPRRGTQARIGWTRIAWAGVKERERSDAEL